MGDFLARDALARSIAARLLCCDEDELRSLDRHMIAIEKRRDILPIASPPNRTRAQEIAAALCELRDATPQRPRRPFEVINGGED